MGTLNIKSGEKALALARDLGFAPITSKRQLYEYSDLLAEIYDLPSTPENKRWRDCVANRIEEYEAHQPLPSYKKSDALKYLMRDRGLKQVDLADCIAQPNLSAFLRGERELSKASARKLSKRLKIPLSVLIG
ncbi:type II toxin-antitoxin system HigA family antitoxin [Polynucleobacter sp. es-MAR-4]|uniref:helix-turn-helix domain-containing protein n=1 Tax=Polynucleobacter sp. es-MAR-4 TaxID=1855655 RepID=UPI001C0DBAA6|nr:hypothetical protein [Polynucleobacter sp. es-MAR-4]MBU3637353.1 hypothetical protein [Polynucleobacter sp. es-MAR-4]